MHKYLFPVRIATLCFGLSSLVWAQGDRGSISGVVLDPSGAAVVNAKVDALNTATNARFETVTTSTGAYRLVALPVGIYNLTVQAPGFQSQVHSNLQIQTNQNAAVDMTLTVGNVAESVTVQAGVPLIQTESADVGVVVESKQFLDLPLTLGGGIRNPSNFIRLSPGVSPTGTWTKSISGGGGFQDQIYYDGIALSRGDLSNDAEVNPSVDAIAEFKLVTNNYSAEYAHAMGGVTSFTMKSGTNDLHGTGFYFVRNEKLDARGFFPATRAPSKQNEWGGTLGGPVVLPKIYNGKDKTFWFFSFDQFYRRGGALGGLNTLPTARMQAGDFGEINRTIYDPASAADPANRTPFPSNIIPQNRFSEVSKKMLPFLPVPELPGIANNSIAPLGSPRADERTAGFKIDHILSPSHRISGMYNDTFRPSIKSPAPSRLIPVGGESQTALLNYNLQKVRTNVLHLNIDSSLTPTTLNHIGLGYSRFRNPNFSLGFNEGWTQPNGGKLGLTGLQFDLFPTVQFDTEGYTRWGDHIASDNYFHTFTALDTITLIRGNHTFKVGAEIQRHRDNYRNFGEGGGFFRFRRETTGNNAGGGDAFASLLLGQVAQGNALFRDSIPGGRYTVFGFFVDDTWKVTNRLTLTLGYRWEPVIPHSDPLGRISYLDPSTPNPAAGNVLGVMHFGGSPGNGNRYLNNLYGNHAPRLGVAYRLTDGTVIRAGAGIFNSNYINQGLGLPAFGYSSNVTFTSPDGNRTAAFDWDNGFPQNFRRPPVIDPTAANGQTATLVWPDQYKLPYKLQWNVAIEQQFAEDLSMSFAYVASGGRHLYSSMGINEVPLQFQNLPVSLLTANINSPEARAAGFSEPFPGFSQLWGTNARVNQAVRMFPQYNNVTVYGSTYGNSSYHSFQYKLDKRYARGLSGTFAYTWSKFLSDAQMFDSAENPAQQTNWQREKSYHNSDYPHVATFSLVWQVPFGTGQKWTSSNKVLNATLGGWQLATVTSISSGGRLFVTTANDLPFFNIGLRPNLVSSNIRSDISMGDYDPNDPARNTYLQRDAFANPAPGTYGSAPRALDVRGPMRPDESFALMKNTKIGERVTHQLRMEIQNPFNRVVFGNPNTDFTNAAFGTINSTAIGPRNIQIGMKLIF
jgi:hypothetical protein